MNRTVIVGGGASGILCAINLHRTKKFDSITIVEKEKGQLFKGIAYSSDLLYQPLNVPVGKMSAFSDEPDHFYNWLAIHKNEYPTLDQEFTKDSFVGRNMYGDYLADLFHKETNGHVNVIQAEVTDIISNDTSHQVVLEDGTTLDAEQVILAWGVPNPSSMGIASNEYYIQDPWAQKWIEKVNPDDSITFIGAGLTMAEQVVSLYRAGHKGTINVLSRRGRLPQPHAPTNDWNTKLDTGLSINETFQQLKENVKQAAEKGINWQSVMDGLRPITSPIWQAWSLEEKQMFLRHLGPFWEIHRHRIPAETNEQLQVMLAEKQLFIFAGRINQVTESPNGISVNYRPRSSKETKELNAKWLINCTGPGNIINSTNPLTQNLFSKGYLTQDTLHSGIQTDDQGHPIKADGQPWANVYTIGFSRKPAIWETTAMREIRSQAEVFGRLNK